MSDRPHDQADFQRTVLNLLTSGGDGVAPLLVDGNQEPFTAEDPLGTYGYSC